MIDFFDDIVQVSDIDKNRQFLELINRSLPKFNFSIFLANKQKLHSGDHPVTLDDGLEKELWTTADTGHVLFHTQDKNPMGLCSFSLTEMNSLLVCRLPPDMDPDTLSILLKDTIRLCVDNFHKDKLLAEEKELLLAHKKQRDGKIRVLEKKYQEILTRNQIQSTEYSKLLQSEIEQQTAELKDKEWIMR